jgi:hypothetical protein
LSWLKNKDLLFSMSITVCSQGSDREWDEINSWPVQMAVGYLTLAYVTRSPLFTIVFGYFWESFELLVLVLNQKFLKDKDSKFAQWAIEKGPLSWLVPPTSDGKARPCVENPMTSLFYDPLIFVGAVCLWSIGAERLIGAKYNQMRAFGVGMQRIIYYITIGFTVVFASHVMFARRLENLTTSGPSDKINGAEPDIGLLMSTLITIILAAFIPVRSGQRNGYTSTEARHAYFAYVVYLLFVMLIVLVGLLGGPFFNIRSSWIRAVIALCVLWAACLLVAAVRWGYWIDAVAGEYLTGEQHVDSYVEERRKELQKEGKLTI